MAVLGVGGQAGLDAVDAIFDEIADRHERRNLAAQRRSLRRDNIISAKLFREFFCQLNTIVYFIFIKIVIVGIEQCNHQLILIGS